MELTEPATALTDYALAAASMYFAIAQGRSIGPRNRVSAWFWCAAFVASGIAAAAGGTYHGFNSLEPQTHQSLWNLAVFAMGACGAFVTAGIHAAFVRRKEGLVLGTARFNRDAAYHLIQIVGLYCLFRCGQTVRDRPGVAPDA